MNGNIKIESSILFPSTPTQITQSGFIERNAMVGNYSMKEKPAPEKATFIRLQL